MWINSSALREWVSDTAPLLAQYVNVNHVLSNSSLYAVGLRIMNESQRERELRPHRSPCEQFHSPPACSQLSSTELRKEGISSWSDFIHFVHLKDLFVWMTRSRPTQHYHLSSVTWAGWEVSCLNLTRPRPQDHERDLLIYTVAEPQCPNDWNHPAPSEGK